MFIDYFLAFAHACDFVIVNVGFLLTVSNDGSACFVAKDTVLSEIGDTSITDSSNVRALDSRSCSNTSMSLSDLDVIVDSDWSIKYDRISLKSVTIEGSVDVSKSSTTVELENGKVWQPYSQP